jgi:transcriptional regulator ATRX
MFKLFFVQVAKHLLLRRIVDEEQMGRHFASSDLTDLYTFNADGQIHLVDSIADQNSSDAHDKLLCELAESTKEWIVAYREHDSFLRNRSEEHIDNQTRGNMERIPKNGI